MRVIIGTYRGPDYVNRSIDSLNEHLHGWTSVTIVDDSGNESWVSDYQALAAEAAEYPDGIQVKVVALPKVGYQRAMTRVCQEAEGEAFLFWEEDFILRESTDLNMLAGILESRSDLAQLALLRGPHFPIEFEHGSVIDALVARLGIEDVDLKIENVSVPEKWGRAAFDQEIITQRGTFTCNPAVWAPGIAALGWPRTQWSEDAKRDQLLGLGYRFGFLPGVRVEHDGVRSGYGY